MSQKLVKIIIVIIALATLVGVVTYFIVEKRIQAPPITRPSQQGIPMSTANWKSFKQETGLYEVKYPSEWNVLSGAGDSVGNDSFGFKTKSGGIDSIISITYFTDTYGETKPKQILDEQSTKLSGLSAVRQTIIDTGGSKVIRLGTTEKRGSLTFRIDLNKLEYLSTFNAMLPTFKFLDQASLPKTVPPSETTQRGIRVTSPNGGEIWSLGSHQTIKWRSLNIPSSIPMTITLREQQPFTSSQKDSILVTATPNDGSEEVVLPNIVGNLIWIGVSTKVDGEFVNDWSDAPFSICDNSGKCLNL